MKRISMIIIALLTLTLPVATSAYPSQKDQKDDDDKKNYSRNQDSHSQFHRALAAEHWKFHQFNRIESFEDRMKHRRFHRYLEAKHRREHPKYCDECWQLSFRLKHFNYRDYDNDWDDSRRNNRHDHH